MTLKNRPYSISFLIILLLLIGIWSFNGIPFTVLPNINYPSYIISFDYESTQPEKIEREFIETIEEKFLSVNQINSITTEIGMDKTIMEIEFDWGSNFDVIYMKLREIIDQYSFSSKIKATITPNKKGFQPLLSIYIFDTNSTTLSPYLIDFVNESIYPKLQAQSGVQFIDGYGFKEPYYSLSPNVNNLIKYNIPLSELISYLQSSDHTIKNAILTANDNTQEIVLHKLKSKFLLSKNNKIPIPFDSLLHIREELSTDTHFEINNTPGIRLDIYAKNTEDISVIAQNIHELVENELRNTSYNWLIKDISGGILLELTSSILKSIFWGMIAVSLLLFYIYKDIKDVLIIIIVIPLTYSISFILFYLLKINLSVILLSSLLLTTGIIIDNTIIILDELKKATDNLRLSFQALVGSTFTNISIFIPLIFLGGFEFELFKDLFWGFSICNLTALISSIVFIPSLFHLIGNKRSESSGASSVLIIHDYIEKSIKFLNLNRRVILFLVLLAIVSFAGLLAKFTFNFFNPIKQDKVHVLITPPSKFQSKNPDQILAQLKQYIPIDTSLIITISSGRSLLSNFENEKRFLKNSIELSIESKIPSDNNVRNIYNAMAPILLHDGWSITDLNENSIFEDFLYPSKENLLITLLHVSRLNIEDVAFLDRSLPNTVLNYPIHQFNYATPKQESYIINHELFTTLFNQLSRFQTVWSNFGVERNAYFDVINNPERDWILIDSSFYKFEDLFNIEKVSTQQRISRHNGIPSTSFIYSGNMDSEYLSKFKDTFLTNNQNTLFNDYFFSGKFITESNFKSVVISLIGSSLLLIFLVLVIQFENIKYALLLIVSLPVAWLGSLMFLYLFTNTITLYSMIGLLVVTGLSINDAILKMTKFIHELHFNSAIEAVIISSKERYKPVIITSLTTIFALLPTILTSTFESNPWIETSLTIIGGMIISTLYSLILFPVLLMILSKPHEK